MAYLKPLIEGTPYGLGVAATGGLTPGQCVKFSAGDTFAPTASVSARSFGICKKAVAAGEQATIYCGGGIYETDAYEGSPAAGNVLTADGTSSKLKVTGEGNFAVAECISCSGGVLRFKLLV